MSTAPQGREPSGPWTIYVCAECGDYGLIFVSTNSIPILECDPGHGEHVGPYRAVEVVPLAEHERVVGALREALTPFAHPRATNRVGGRNHPEDDVMTVEVTAGDWLRACVVLGYMDPDSLTATVLGDAAPSAEFVERLGEQR